jgi:hypothetical protein
VTRTPRAEQGWRTGGWAHPRPPVIEERRGEAVFIWKMRDVGDFTTKFVIKAELTPIEMCKLLTTEVVIYGFDVYSSRSDVEAKVKEHLWDYGMGRMHWFADQLQNVEPKTAQDAWSGARQRMRILWPHIADDIPVEVPR